MNIDKARKNYLTPMDDDELEKFEAKSYKNTNQSSKQDNKNIKTSFIKYI